MPEPTWYRLLDVLFLAFHSLLVGFNLIGWAWRRTRRLHLFAISATLLSWFGLGIAYGWGYCPLTDWHWQVKRALGETGLPASWVKYHLDLVTGLDWSRAVVDTVVIGAAAGVFVLSVALNWRDRARRRVNPRPSPGRPPPSAPPPGGRVR